MLEFGGLIYYIDLVAFENAILLKPSNASTPPQDVEIKRISDADDKTIQVETTVRSIPVNREIDISKYEMLKNFIDYLMDYNEETGDTTLGANKALENTNLGFKLIFNTLLHEEIIKEMD